MKVAAIARGLRVSLAALVLTHSFTASYLGAFALDDINISTTSIECDVYLVAGLIKEGPPQEYLHCLLSEQDEMGHILYEIKGLGKSEFQLIKTAVSSGDHRFKFPGARKSAAKPAQSSRATSTTETQSIHVEDNKFQLLNKDSNRVKRDDREYARRHLYTNSTKVSTVLVVRIAAQDSETTCTINDCRVSIFGGKDDAGVIHDINIKTQIDACSFGKLKFVPPEDNPKYPDVVGGVVTVPIDKTVVGITDAILLDLLLIATPGLAGPLDQYDHVMFFMPGEVDFRDAVAWGDISGRYTWFLGDYSVDKGAQLHELGHNLGLDHSHKDEDVFFDGTCRMGAGYGRQCYNAPKLWYLEWFREFHREFNPLKDESALYRLASFTDYDEVLAMTPSEQSKYAIIIQIETYEQERFYISYNRAEKMTDTSPYEQEVVIHRADRPGQGISWIDAWLRPGQKYSIPMVNFGLSLEIVVCQVKSDTLDYSVVSIHPFGQTPLCHPSTPSPVGPFQIRNPQSGKLLSISNGECVNDQPIVIWTDENLDSQKWMLNHDSSIESIHCPGMVIQTQDTSCDAWTSIVLYKKSSIDIDAQRWLLRSNGVLSNRQCWRMSKDFSMDLEYDLSDDGTPIIMHDTHARWNQQWSFARLASTPSLKPSAMIKVPTSIPTKQTLTNSPTPSPEGPFYIRNPQSGKLLSINNGECVNDQPIVIWTDENLDSQKWMRRNDGSIESVHCPGMVIQTQGTSCDAWTSIVLHNKSSVATDTQTWFLKANGVLINVHCWSTFKDVSMDMYFDLSDDGTPIIIYDTHARWNQQWTYVRLTSTTIRPTRRPTKI